MPAGDLEPAEAKRIQQLDPLVFARIWTSWSERDPELADAALKARCRTDRVLFARHFFLEKLADERTGAPIPFHEAHLAFLEAPKPGYRERGPGEGWRRAWMLPRGNGKTTVCLRIELSHDIVYGLERYIAILAESAQLSRARVFEVAIELEQNHELRRIFGDLVGEEIWRRNTGEILTKNGVTILAKSMESQVRGLLHPITNARPTKIVLDDAEDSQDVLNPMLRERDRRRFNEDIEGAASVDGSTSFNFTGTPLHREALLPSLEKNAAWEFRRFPAIRKWPTRMDLWERCRLLWAAAGEPEVDEDATGDERLEANRTANQVAEQFYLANKKAMEAGADVLWPERESLLRLMLWRWANGEAAFSKEKLLVPRDPSLATFEIVSDEYPRKGALRTRLGEDEHGKTLVIDQRSGGTRVVHLKNLRFVSFHDPAKADPHASKSSLRSLDSDYACITVMGIETDAQGHRIGHIIDAYLQRQPVSRQIAAHFGLVEKWGIELAIVEQDTLGLLRTVYRDERARRVQAGLFSQIPLHALERQTKNKDARIATMQPAVEAGRITFSHALPGEYMNQWIDHPTGAHDDAPDSAEGCWRFSGRKRVGLSLVSLGGE